MFSTEIFALYVYDNLLRYTPRIRFIFKNTTKILYIFTIFLLVFLTLQVNLYIIQVVRLQSCFFGGGGKHTLLQGYDDMTKLMIFACTSEALELIKRCRDYKNLSLDIFTNASGAEKHIPLGENITLHTEETDEVALAVTIGNMRPDLIVDASGGALGKHISKAASVAGIRCIVLSIDKSIEAYGLVVDNVAKAVKMVGANRGNILLSGLSAKDFASIPGFSQRCFWENTDQADTQKAIQEGVARENIINMPSKAKASDYGEVIKRYNIKYILTTSSVENIYLKRQACKACNAVLVAVKGENEMSLDKTLLEVRDLSGKKKLNILAIGPGRQSLMSMETQNALTSSHALIGEEETLKLLDSFKKEKVKTDSIKDMLSFIISSSGNIFSLVYTDSEKLFSSVDEITEYCEKEGIEVNNIVGVSTSDYLAGKINISSNGVKKIDARQKGAPFLNDIKENTSIFIHAGKNASLILSRLCDEGLERIRVCVGMDLSLERERILSGYPEDLKSLNFSENTLLYMENDEGGESLKIGIKENKFLIPDDAMALASEVRAVIMSKFSLKRSDNILFAGGVFPDLITECALNLPNGRAYILEEKGENISIIGKNAARFSLSNIDTRQCTLRDETTVKEEVSQMEDIACVFSDSSVGIENIYTALLKKDSTKRYVLALYSPEEVARASKIFEKYDFENIDLCLMNISKGKRINGKTNIKENDFIYILTADTGF